MRSPPCVMHPQGNGWKDQTGKVTKLVKDVYTMHIEYTHCLIACPKLKLGCILNSLQKEKKVLIKYHKYTLFRTPDQE